MYVFPWKVTYADFDFRYLSLILDNVNIHGGYQRHHRLFKVPKVNIWNFTVRGLPNPDITGNEDLFGAPETSLQSQDNVVE